MAYLDELLRQRTELIQGSSRFDGAIANLWPAHEVQTPAYGTVSAYALAQLGLRGDELVFSCIDRRATAISEPPVQVVKRSNGKRGKKEQVESPITRLLDRPNSEMGSSRFLRAVSQGVDAFGFSVWEIEVSRAGEPIALWPMQPQFVSFLRGPQAPIRAVRYQYPGLPPYDVPRDRLLIFQDFDPLYPFTRALSRTAVALKSIGVHNATGGYLKDFFDRGAVPQGILSTEQMLTNAEAKRQKDLWNEHHGGSGKWGEIAVLGGGVKYQTTESPLKDMAFDAVDGRTEALICMTFALSPVILGAKVGLNASTYSNFDAALTQMYAQAIRPQWRTISDELTAQLLPRFGAEEGTVCDFDLSEVAAVSESEDKLVDRAVKLAEKNLIYRDEARDLIGWDAIDGGEKVFIGLSISAGDSASSPVTNLETDFDEMSAQQAEKDAQAADARAAQLAALNGKPTDASARDQAHAENPEPTLEERVDEMKAWKRDALDRVGEGVGTPFDAELIGLATRSAVRGVFERHWPRAVQAPSAALADLTRAIEEAAAKL